MVRTDDLAYEQKITLLKRTKEYRPLIPILNELRERIDQLKADLEAHKQPRSRGRPKKVKENIINI